MALSHFAFAAGVILLGASVWLLVPALLAAIYLAWRNTVAMEHLTDATEAIAQGDFERRVPEQHTPGVKRLADAVNLMARTSIRRVSMLTADRNRLATIFAGMVEGVVDVDEKQNIIHINDAAALLLGLVRENSIGKPVWQVIRNQKITLDIDDAIRNRTVIKARVDYPRVSERLVFDIYVASLSDDQGGPIGAVLVLHDVTELKHLERIRTDFVANASHELKTPITAIRGLAETMVGDPDVEKSMLMQYMERIHSQSLRLSNLVTDLMTISRLESDQGTSSFTRMNFNDLVRREVRAAASAVEIKFHSLTLDPFPEPLEVYGDRQNLSQLCNNLFFHNSAYTFSVSHQQRCLPHHHQYQPLFPQWHSFRPVGLWVSIDFSIQPLVAPYWLPFSPNPLLPCRASLHHFLFQEPHGQTLYYLNSFCKLYRHQQFSPICGTPY